MQLWFFTLMVLPLTQYYMTDEEERAGKWYLIIIAGISMALEVLSYPSCLILFPFFLGYICVQSKQSRWRDMLIFGGTCALCAIIWLICVLRHVGISEFIANFINMLNSDLTHDITGATNGKGMGIVRNLIGGAKLTLLAVLLQLPLFLIAKKKITDWNKDKAVQLFLVFFIFATECIQLYYWVIVKSGYEVYHLHLYAASLAGLVAWRYAGDEKKNLFPGICGTILSLIAVIYISDLEMFYALPHGVLGVVFCLVILILTLKKGRGKDSDKWIRFLLIAFCLLAIFGKGYTMRGGRNYNVVLDTTGIIKHGPAIGVLSDYMSCYINDCCYEDFINFVSEDDVVLIVTNTFFSQGTTPYMMVGADVAHYSIVDPTAYDERLLAYWELYPEKEPNVIVVDCWYGRLLENPDNWIMKYIENDFGYTQVNDGKYVRFYRK